MALENSSSTLKPESYDEAQKYREVLSAVAVEIHRYLANTTTAEVVKRSPYLTDHVATKIRYHQQQLKAKTHEISKLKSHIRSACILAKSVITSKENETRSLCTLLNQARSEISLLQGHVKRNQEVIKKLSIENQVLFDKLNSLINFIDLGYGELRKITGDDMTQDVPVTFELKKIIVTCGQYFANYCNEQQKALNLHQKNLFLSNTVCALHANLENIMKEIERLRNDNLELMKQNDLLERKINDTTCIKNTGENVHKEKPQLDDTYNSLSVMQRDIVDLKSRVSDIQRQLDNISIDSLIKCHNNEHKRNKNITGPEEFDLKRHISIVTNLLRDQDSMLQELKNISRELRNESKFDCERIRKGVMSRNEVNQKSNFATKSQRTLFRDSSTFDYNQGEFYNFLNGEDSNVNSLISNVNGQGWCNQTYKCFQRASNTMVLYKTKEDRDDKSTIYGITSEMQELLDGRVASKVQTFENISGKYS